MPATLHRGVTIATISDWEELNALEPAWFALWQCCPTATPFQSPGWLIPWAQRWARYSLQVMIVREEDDLIGLAPFFLHANPPGERTVRLLGEGISDTLDMLFAPGQGEMVASVVFTALEAQSESWDACDWQQLRPHSPLLRISARPGWSEIIEVQDAYPTVQLSPTQSLEDALPPSFVRRLRADRRRLERNGPVHVEQACTENFQTCFDSLLRLHTARWSLRNQPGVLAEPAVQGFHREAASRLLDHGILRFLALHVAGQIAAAYYGFMSHGRSSYYLGGFDPALRAFGVGHQMVWESMRAAHHEGAHAFDFLRGQESYKYSWGAVDTPAYRRRITQAS